MPAAATTTASKSFESSRRRRVFTFPWRATDLEAGPLRQELRARRRLIRADADAGPSRRDHRGVGRRGHLSILLGGIAAMTSPVAVFVRQVLQAVDREVRLRSSGERPRCVS